MKSSIFFLLTEGTSRVQRRITKNVSVIRSAARLLISMHLGDCALRVRLSSCVCMPACPHRRQCLPGSCSFCLEQSVRDSFQASPSVPVERRLSFLSGLIAVLTRTINSAWTTARLFFYCYCKIQPNNHTLPLLTKLSHVRLYCAKNRLN